MRASSRRPRVVALSLWLVWRQPMVVATYVLAGIAAIAAGALTVQARGSGAAHAPALTAIATAWSIGIMLAFCGALRAIPRDMRQGVIALASARGVRTSAYAFGRIFGLAAMVGIGIGGATFVASICALSVTDVALPAVKSTCGAFAYCAAFAATIGPLAMAALGWESRAAGYLSFVAVLVVPELAASSGATIFPSGWHELTSIPAALDAIRAGVESPRSDGLPAIRALTVLAALVVISWAIVNARAARQRARWQA